MSKPTFDSKWFEEYEERMHKSAQARARAGAGLPSPVAQPAVCHEPLAAEQREEENTSRPVLCIISFRTRLLDSDNATGGCKYLQDALRYSGVIDEDAFGDVDLRVYQHKVRTVKEEKTLILIYKEPVPW